MAPVPGEVDRRLRYTALLHQTPAQRPDGARDAAAATRVTDEEWWTVRSAQLTELAHDFTSRFPLLTALESGGDPDPEERNREGFRSGLAVLPDGIEASTG
ncbi:hypothetical protein [Kitasatospora aureofaciens]|uniref:hypothetical protein n=1 Tax=Kitasatospora aureofaciens TaxID=1894 RepID=UPI0027E0CF0B|nr:hypothetical protein [Kitasatospora aureofaciens]